MIRGLTTVTQIGPAPTLRAFTKFARAKPLLIGETLDTLIVQRPA